MFTVRGHGAVLVAALSVGLAAPASSPAEAVRSGGTTVRTPVPASAPDRTDAVEERRVARALARTPAPSWSACGTGAQCAVVEVPLDYDRPDGPATSIAVLRVGATDPARRIGTLFVNPGGPGASAVDMAQSASIFLSSTVRERFDIVGFDPRGIGHSEQLACFTDPARQATALAGLQALFPWTAQEENAAMASARAMGAACGSTGGALASAMSTAQAARDMELLRRAIGDSALSYLGFSYGSYLGLVHANMFPDHVRAIAVDGVIDPVGWAGAPRTASRILDDRLGTADGSYKALHEILGRCGRTAVERCGLARSDPVALLERVAQRLRTAPLRIGSGTSAWDYTYADMVGTMLEDLYQPDGADSIISLLDALADLVSARSSGDTAAAALAGREVRLATEDSRKRSEARAGAPSPAGGLATTPYDNFVESMSAVICSDGLHPSSMSLWPAATAAADERAPYFGRAWGWSSLPCATESWTAQDEDAYRGPFDRRTAAPVLLVGNYWDPATPYTSALSAAALSANGRLLSSDSWGHTAYGTSDCVTDAVDAYLVDGVLPPEGTLCHGDVQPFEPLADSARTAGSTGTGKQLPPVPGPRPVAAAERAGEPVS